MKAMVLRKIIPLQKDSVPLELVEMTDPVPQSGEVLIRVSACGVCHTELDEIEGRTAPTELPRILGHEVVGQITAVGADADQSQVGQRVGVGWIHSSTGTADENLSPEFKATGRDVNGGYAELMTVPQQYAYPVPSNLDDIEVAPLLCAGAVGYRSVKLSGLKDGQSLGLMGFGGSAHLVIQMVRHQFPNSPVYVFARSPESRAYAQEMGAVWAGDTLDNSPELLDAVIDTTPAWQPVMAALSNLKPGGRLVINAIRKEDNDKTALLDLSYHDHLWMEREIKSVANVTQFDLQEFLPIASMIPIRPKVQTYPLEEANQALHDLKFKSIQGAKVLSISAT